MPKLVGENVLMRIFVGEGDKFGGRPLHEALVEFLKEERFHGATVLRGVAGFGRSRGERPGAGRQPGGCGCRARDWRRR